MAGIKTALKEYQKARKAFIKEIFKAYPSINHLGLHNYGGETVISEINGSDFPLEYDDLEEFKDAFKIEDEDDSELSSELHSWLVEYNFTINDITDLVKALLSFPLEGQDEDVSLKRSDYIKPPKTKLDKKTA